MSNCCYCCYGWWSSFKSSKASSSLSFSIFGFWDRFCWGGVSWSLLWVFRCSHQQNKTSSDLYLIGPIFNLFGRHILWNISVDIGTSTLGHRYWDIVIGTSTLGRQNWDIEIVTFRRWVTQRLSLKTVVRLIYLFNFMIFNYQASWWSIHEFVWEDTQTPSWGGGAPSILPTTLTRLFSSFFTVPTSSPLLSTVFQLPPSSESSIPSVWTPPSSFSLN